MIIYARCNGMVKDPSWRAMDGLAASLHEIEKWLAESAELGSMERHEALLSHRVTSSNLAGAGVSGDRIRRTGADYI